MPEDVGPFRFAIGYRGILGSRDYSPRRLLETRVTWSIAGWQEAIDKKKVYHMYKT